MTTRRRSGSSSRRRARQPGYFAIVNAATGDSDRPFAMHLTRNDVVRGDPELQMQLRRLQYRTSDGTLPARQVWGAVFKP
ncbi:hypothetical protein SAMN06273567_103440 [Geodermatophilus aquaeductus]|uniref:Uncharacterized protein n=1 Tax=Geodermatophilus aquaeductus TaxID=1564161 RepID=A0A521DQC6_9ACTN|nr:hypothetical protein [Geodermatophilus aquaeductus]SMO73917.1 hypothetical protein SAMN06273567_103440 [Geodermatophilus aquaeductus]